MPALVAMRFNPDLKAKYTQLRAAGKPAKVAIATLMRKLIETANALIKADRLWVENRLIKTNTHDRKQALPGNGATAIRVVSKKYCTPPSYGSSTSSVSS